MTTFARFAQVCREVLMDGTPKSQFAQVAREVLLDGTPMAQLAQCAREVLMSDIPVNVAVYTPRPMRFPPYVEPPARRARRMIYPIQAFYWPPTHRAAPMSLESPAILRAHFLPILAVISVTTRPFVFVQT